MLSLLENQEAEGIEMRMIVWLSHKNATRVEWRFMVGREACGFIGYFCGGKD